MRNYRIVEEKIGDRIETVMVPLLIEHWEEVAKNKHLMVLNPDLKKYKELDRRGELVALFAYVDDEIVGYSFNILSNHLHYVDLLCAYNDVIFIAKDHRESPLGLRLIRETERTMKRHGAELMLWHAKENTPLAKILPRLKCNVQELVFSKEL